MHVFSSGTASACCVCQRLLALKEFMAIHLIDQHAPATEYGFGFVSSTWSYQVVSHLSTLQAESCLASVFKWELVFPTWRGSLTLLKLFGFGYKLL